MAPYSTTTLLRRPLHLELLHPSGGLGLGQHEEPDDLVDDLDVAGRQNLEQRRLLADLDQAAAQRLDIALDCIQRVLARGVPGQREHVGEVVGEAVALAEGLDEVGLEVRRVQQYGREAQR